MAKSEIDELRQMVKDLEWEASDARAELDEVSWRLKDAEHCAYSDAEINQFCANQAALVAIADHLHYVRIGCEPLSMEKIEAILEAARQTEHCPV